MRGIGDALAALNKGVKPYSSYGDGLHEFKEAFATSCCIDKLFSKGIVKINGIIIDNYQRYGVVLFDSPTSMKYYEELRDLFLEDGYQDLIYYAVVDPATVTQEQALVFGNFEQQSFRFDGTKQGFRIANSTNMRYGGQALMNLIFSILVFAKT